MRTIRFHAAIAELPAAEWDALRTDTNPFVSHAFLAALEHNGCIRPEWGWQAHHLGLYEDGRLLAAAPLYLKGNSHGEFVFDFSWANAFERAGGDYYPKLLGAVPYSPVPGPRLLATNNADKQKLVAALIAETQRLGLSSVHVNFLCEADLAAFDERWLKRFDWQFHWHNQGYRHFEAFLATLTGKKRKNIRQERRQARESGLKIAMEAGSTISDEDWCALHALYETTFDMKGNHAAMTLPFFQHLGHTLGDRVQVATARRVDGRVVAMALCLVGDSTLYGRYWGSLVEVPGLHFELCYYLGIEFCIANQLQTFEPGAQGEHKMARGFLPTRTHSRHYLANESFHEAVRNALEHEAQSSEAYFDELMEHSPYTPTAKA
ncbi:MAG: GNAT family N-acetyltransferase [Rhodanobacter sp.]